MTALHVLSYIGLIIDDCLLLIGMAGIFKKAGETWWKALIPFYNVYILAKLIIPKKMRWTFVLLFVPLMITRFITMVYYVHRLRKHFYMPDLNNNAWGTVEKDGSFSGYIDPEPSIPPQVILWDLFPGICIAFLGLSKLPYDPDPGDGFAGLF